MSLKRLVQAQLGVEGAVFPHDADFAGSTREEDERADTDTARNGVDGTASDPDVEPVANLQKGEQAGENSTPRPASEKTSARPLTSGKAQCLVEGVVRDKEQTISLVDPTTKCAVVTVFALGKPALDSTIRTTHKLNCTTDLQATDSDFMDRPQIQNVESAHDHGDEDAATADAADGGSVARVFALAEQTGALTGQMAGESLCDFLDEVVDLERWYTDECASDDDFRDTHPLSTPVESKLPADLAVRTHQLENAQNVDYETPIRLRDHVQRVLNALYEEAEIAHVDKDASLAFANAITHPAMRQRHMNWLPIWSVIESSQALFVTCGWTPHTLESMIKFNYQSLRPSTLPSKRPPRLGELSLSAVDVASDEPLRFVMYQLVRAVSFLHKQGLFHGRLCPQNVNITGDLWVWLHPPLDVPVPRLLRTLDAASPWLPPAGKSTLSEGLTEAWRQGRVSNLDYLMAVNAAAGRHLADANFHPVIPWVTDFSSSDLDDPEQTHWRDLTQSKYRLAKGDDQLDITFCNSPTPHHITESLSEITYYIYMARVTPLATLRSVVRSNFEAKEYPASMARMYEWTPDECIPEFFFDASVFSSMHADIDLPDLGFPKWCRDASDFVRWHRAALESTHVSRSLHHWIDLNFGNKLAGEAAVASKNVTLPLSSMPKHRLRKSPGFVQVFTEAHPAREVENAGNARGNMDNFERGARFERFFGPMIAPTYTKLESEKDRADACLDVARWQADDCFALGCIAAEMYLRQPLLTSSRRHALLSRDEAVAVDLILPELRRLPRRVRDFVGRALTAPKLDALLDLVGETVFPDWFAAVYDFLSASQHCRTWLERFHWVKKELGPLLERVSDDPSERKRALNLAMPSVLALMLEANDEVRALMPIELVLIAGPLLDVRELLPTVVETYERMQAKEQWSLLLPALEAKTCMRVLDYVGATLFANLYPPLLVETLRSSTAPANVRAAAADAAIALARAPTFGIALSVRMILTPLLKRWQVTRASLGEGGVNRGTYAHLRQFGIEALAPAKLTALLDKFCSILDGGPARSRTDLVLPVHAPAVKVIRYITARAGRMVATELVFPAAFKALSKTFLQNDASEEERIQASVRRMDVLSFFSCVLSMLEEEDLYAWFLERSELRELLAAQPGETVEDQLASVYVAVLLGLVVSHVGHHEIAPVLEASANALRAAAAPRCPPGQLWMARFIFAAFEARWGEERIRAYYPTLAPSNLRRCLAIPDSYREPGPSQVAVPRRDQGVGKLELTQDAPRDCVFDAGINTDNGDPCSPSGGAHEDMEAAVEVADEFEDELGAEELLLVETSSARAVCASTSLSSSLPTAEPLTATSSLQSSQSLSSSTSVPPHSMSPPLPSGSQSSGTEEVTQPRDTPPTFVRGTQRESPSNGTRASGSVSRDTLRRTLSAAVNSDEVGVREGEVEERDARQESEARAGLEEQARMERTWLLGPDLGSESTSSASAVPEVVAKRRKRGTLRGAVSHVLRAHQTAIITIEANSDETLLASTSRSSSVKLFSIAGKPREVASFRNARPVSGLRFLELGRKCILLDGAVRLWDVEYGHERSRGAEGNFVAGSPPRLRTVPIGVAHRPVLTVQSARQQSLANENVIWASTIAGTVDCLDFRVPGHTVSSHQLPAVDESPSTVPLQRSQAHQASSASNGGFCASSIVCGGSFSGGWIAAGRASGHVSVLDARTGGSLAHWKAHEGGVVSLQALNLVQPVIQTDELVHEAAAYQLLSISAEGSARVWDVSRQGGFENAGDVPWNSQRRPACRIRVVGLPRAARFSRVLAPQVWPKRPTGGLAQGSASQMQMQMQTLSQEQAQVDPFGLPRLSSLLGGGSGQQGHLGGRSMSPSLAAGSPSSVRERSASADVAAPAALFEAPVLETSPSTAESGVSGTGVSRGAEDGTVAESAPLAQDTLEAASSLRRSESAGFGNTASALDDLAARFARVSGPNASLQEGGAPPGPQDAKSSVMSPPSPSRGGNNRRGGRVYVSIPQCDTASIWSETATQGRSPTKLVIGADNRISVVTLEMRARATEVTAKPVGLRDFKGEGIGRGALRIGALRVLPMRGLVLVAGDNGCIHSVV